MHQVSTAYGAIKALAQPCTVKARTPKARPVEAAARVCEARDNVYVSVLSVCLSVCLSACLSVCVVGLWVCGFVGLWVCGFVGLWVCGFVGLWVCGFVGLWVCGFVGLCVVVFVFAVPWLCNVCVCALYKIRISAKCLHP